MYGAAMGTLLVEASNDGLVWTELFTRSGDQGNSWIQATVSLNDFTGAYAKIRISGTTGSSFTSDIAVDSFTITESNAAPVFPGYSVGTPYQSSVDISIFKVLAKASDPDGDAISITAVANSANGGTVLLGASYMTYTPAGAFSGTDTFDITITDAHGLSATGTITVVIESSGDDVTGGQGNNSPKLTPVSDGGGGTNMEVSFYGIPGRIYIIQRSTNLSLWEQVGQVTAATNGKVAFVDETPPESGSVFYRLSW
jgi:hypothetical protein